MQKESLKSAKPALAKRFPAPADVNTRLAHKRTDLALDRTYQAAERTLMAWVRTSLSMISFGFALGKIGQFMTEIRVQGILGTTRTVSVTGLAYFLIVLGTGALLGAAFQHRRRTRELRAKGLPPRFSIAFLVALVLSAVGFLAFTSIVLSL